MWVQEEKRVVYNERELLSCLKGVTEHFTTVVCFGSLAVHQDAYRIGLSDWHARA